MRDRLGKPPLRLAAARPDARRRDPVSSRLVACMAISATVAFFHAEIWQMARESAPMQWAIDRLAGVATDPQPGNSSSAVQIVARLPPKNAGSSENIQRTSATRIPVCGSGKRHTCVVDGDTFWFNGEKIRLAGIDAPEIQGKCSYEKNLAAKATQRLSQILSRQALSIERSGQDRFGRTLADVGDAGDILISEGLARRWTGQKEVWCNG